MSGKSCISAEPQGHKTDKGTIAVLAIKDDSLAVERVTASVSAMRGAWAVHRTVSRGRVVPRRWSVSHAPTGKTFVADLKTRREAIAIADRMVDFPPGDEKEIPAETRLGFCKIQRELASGLLAA